MLKVGIAGGPNPLQKKAGENRSIKPADQQQNRRHLPIRQAVQVIRSRLRRRHRNYWNRITHPRRLKLRICESRSPRKVKPASPPCTSVHSTSDLSEGRGLTDTKP